MVGSPTWVLGPVFPVCRLNNHPSWAAGSPDRIECQKGDIPCEVIRDLGLAGARVLVSRYEELTEEVAAARFRLFPCAGEFVPFLEWAHSEKVAAKQVILWIGARDLQEIEKVQTWECASPSPCLIL